MNFFFFILLILGSFMAVSSSSWFSAWIGLELNLISFIPLLINKKNYKSPEVSIKYFLVQAMASTIIIFSSSLFMFNDSFNLPIFMALSLKMGAAPFHFWFPQVMEGLMWPQILIMLTIQKLAPMFLMSYIKTNFILLIVIFCASFGALGTFKFSSLRKILAFSSINHMAWMLTMIYMNNAMWFIYFLFYSFISISITFFFMKTNLFSLISMSTLNFKSIFFPINILSLGGLPPFLGFIPKWMIIQTLYYNNMTFIIVILMISSLVIMYIYMQMILYLLLLKPCTSYKPVYINSHLLYFFTFLNLTGILIPIFFYM